jgi:RNA polymerase sigma factor (sigma-70 family)
MSDVDPPPAAPARHPSALALHEYQVALLAPPEAEAVERHLSTCERCRIHRHIDRLPDPKDVLRWIYRIATNYCLNEIRDRKLRPAPVERSTAGASDDPIADRDLVSPLIHQVPEKLRAVAWLYHADGLEQAEVAAILGISRRTVVNRLAEFQERGRRVLGRT